MIKDYKKEMLEEKYDEYYMWCRIRDRNKLTFRDFVIKQSEAHPAFFKWLFDKDKFRYELSDEEKQEFNDFLKSL